MQHSGKNLKYHTLGVDSLDFPQFTAVTDIHVSEFEYRVNET